MWAIMGGTAMAAQQGNDGMTGQTGNNGMRGQTGNNEMATPTSNQETERATLWLLVLTGILAIIGTVHLFQRGLQVWLLLKNGLSAAAWGASSRSTVTSSTRRPSSPVALGEPAAPVGEGARRPSGATATSDAGAHLPFGATSTAEEAALRCRR